MKSDEAKKTAIFKKWWFWTAIIILVAILILLVFLLNKPSLIISNNSLANTKDELLLVLNKNLYEKNEKLESFKEVKGNKTAEENDLKLYETIFNSDVSIQCVEKDGKIQSIKIYSFLDESNSKEAANNVGYINGVIIRELGTSEEESNRITTELSKDYTDSEAESKNFIVIMQTTDYYGTMMTIFNKEDVDILKTINSEETTNKLNELKQEDIIKTFNDSIKKFDELVKNENNSVSDLKGSKLVLQGLKSEVEELFKEHDSKNELPKAEEEKEKWLNSIDDLINHIDSKIKVTVPDFNNMTSTEAETWGKENNISVTTSTEYSDSIPNGEVISQSINAGETIIKGESSIKVKYSLGRKPTTGELNALKKAQSYSDHMHMSKKGLYKQLTSTYGEGFTESEAQYAIDHLNADWNYNALQKAKSYQSTLNMSKNRIYQQLISEYGENFTASEAQYAIDNLDD